MLGLLESLCSSGIKFAGFADNDGTSSGRWSNLKVKMQDRLFQWESGCIESDIIRILPEHYLENLLKDSEGGWDGDSLEHLLIGLELTSKSLDE